MEQNKEWVKNHFADEQMKTMEDLGKQSYSEEARSKIAAGPVWTEVKVGASSLLTGSEVNWMALEKLCFLSICFRGNFRANRLCLGILRYLDDS